MPLLRNDVVLAGSWTIPGFANFLKAAFAQAGMPTLHDEFDWNNRRVLVWERITDSARDRGKFYLVIAFNTEGLRQAVVAEYSQSTSSLPSTTQWSLDLGLNSFSEYVGVALRSEEAGIVNLISPSTAEAWMLGWLRPAGKPDFWSEDTAPYVFCAKFNEVWISSERSPYQENYGYGPYFGEFRDSFAQSFTPDANPITNQPNIVVGGYLYSINFGTQGGFVGALSHDWGAASTRFMQPGQLIEVSGGSRFSVTTPAFFSKGATVAAIAPESSVNGQFASVPGSLLTLPASAAPPGGTPCQFVPIDVDQLAAEIAERIDLSQVCRWEPCPTPTPTPTPTSPTEGQLFP